MRLKTGAVLGASVLALGLGSLATGAAQAPGLDPGYGSAEGFVNTPMSDTTADRFFSVAAAPDWSTYNVGVTTTAAPSNDQRFAVMHIDANGKVDRSFGSNGVASINVYAGANAEVARGVVVQQHGANKGKIVVSGQAESAADAADIDIYVVRFNTNGTPDTTFGGDGSAVRVLNLSPGIVGSTRSPDNTWGLMIQPDDKIVLEAVRGNGAVGTPNANRADRDFAAIRLNANGTRDTRFGTDGVASIGAVFTENGQTIQAIENPRQGVIQPDGKIVLGGYAQINGLERVLLARFNANGTPDTTFGGNAGAPGIATAFPNGQNGTAEVYELAMQGAKFVTAGYGTPTPHISLPDMISMRFTSTGALDTTYANNGIFRWDAGAADRARDLTLIPDGRIFLAGATETLVTGVGAATNALAVVLKPNGTLDTSFGKGGLLQVDPGGTADWFYGTALLPSGKVVAVGYKGGVPSSGDDASIARFDVGYVPVPAAAAVSGLRHNSTINRGPSTLTGTVTPATGVSKVMVKLTKGSGATCRAYNLAKQAFTGTNCARNAGFAAVYSKGKWTVYLGAPLPNGVYALEAVTVTSSGKKQAVTTGQNAIRFTVAA